MELAFVATRKIVVATAVPQSIYDRLRRLPGGVGGFYEEAVQGFDGNLESLVLAAVEFIQKRKRMAVSDPVLTASGRVSAETVERIDEIKDALQHVRGMSRAKVLAGFIALTMKDWDTA